MYGIRERNPDYFPNKGYVKFTGQSLKTGGTFYDGSYYAATDPNSGTRNKEYLIRSGGNKANFSKVANFKTVRTIVGYRKVLRKSKPPRYVKVQCVNRKTGAVFFKRKRLLEERLIPIYKKSRVYDRPPNSVLPNPLSLYKYEITPYGREVKAHKPKDQYGGPFNQTYTGDLGLGLRPVGYSTNIGHVPQAYITPVFSTGYISSAELAAIDSMLLGRIREKVRNTDFNLGQFVAEIEQTVGLFIDIVKRVAVAILQLKRGKILRAAQKLFPESSLSKQFANDVLIFQYGIRPLLQDIDSAMKALAHGAVKEGYFDIIAATRRTVVKPPSVGSDGIVNNYPRYQSTCNRKCQVTVKYKARIKVARPEVATLASLGLTDPATIVWELTPWSFVIDWFLKVGDYLQNLRLFDGLVVESLHKTVVFEETGAINIKFSGTNAHNFNWDGNPEIGAYWKQFKCDRIILDTTLLTKPPLPRFKNPLSLEHGINALALLRQLRP